MPERVLEKAPEKGAPPGRGMIRYPNQIGLNKHDLDELNLILKVVTYDELKSTGN